MHAQGGGERFCRLLPGVIERAVVDEAEHSLACLRRLEFCPKEAAAQGRAVAQGGNYLRHQAVNGGVRGREGVDAHGFAVGAGHGEMAIVVLVPDAKFGAHAVTFWWRRENFRLRRGKGRKHRAQAAGFVIQLALVCCHRFLYGSN